MNSSSGQLLRLLRLIPLAARPDGIVVGEAARLCGVSEGQIDKDFRLLGERAWYLPPGRTDDFQIGFLGDRIVIDAPPAFTRPIRLGLHELLAVSLALRCAGMERDEARELCRTLEAACALTPVPDEAGAERGAATDATDSTDVADEHVEFDLAHADADEVHDELSRAIVLRRRVRIGYVKEAADAPEVRHIEPWYLLHAEGEAYLVAHDVDRAAPRLFRLDRILGTRMTEEACTEAVSIGPSAVGAGGSVQLVVGDVPEEFAEVRYSSQVARWVRERYEGEEMDDGSYLVRHPILAEAWLVRHVLRYGEDAEVLRPARLRDAVVRALAG